jgi:hypothetical protein
VDTANRAAHDVGLLRRRQQQQQQQQGQQQNEDEEELRMEKQQQQQRRRCQSWRGKSRRIMRPWTVMYGWRWKTD